MEVFRLRKFLTDLIVLAELTTIKSLKLLWQESQQWSRDLPWWKCVGLTDVLRECPWRRNINYSFSDWLQQYRLLMIWNQSIHIRESSNFDTFVHQHGKLLHMMLLHWFRTGSMVALIRPNAFDIVMIAFMNRFRAASVLQKWNLKFVPKGPSSKAYLRG